MAQDFTQSLAALERAKKVIPLASQTFSKCYTQLSVGAAPLFLDRGAGSHVWDVDGNEYIDQMLALAPISLGFAYPEVDEAIITQVRRGSILSLPGKLEAELAERICAVVPCAEMVRYGKNGSDMTSAAVRVARAYTGRDVIVCCGYHGWQDWYIGTTTRNKGVPPATRALTKTFTYNDISSLEQLFRDNEGQIAAVIMEPIGVEFPRDNFLQKVAEVTRKHGAILIFDELVTGFRLALGGAQAYFDVTPDLACFGKAVANGYPLSVVAGKRELMREFEDIFFSFTFGGDLISLAAGLATLTVLEREPVIEHNNKLGHALQEAFNASAREYGLADRARAIGFGSHHVVQFKDKEWGDDLAAKTVFQEIMIQHGVLTIGSNNVCYSHNQEDINNIIAAYRVALAAVKEGLANDRLEQMIRGRKLEPVFRKP
ncbi:MAG: aminotransferase class III-fold pyridoxal phosphate-dependent enzyme [Candidatus Magasanikbacteria bacterium]|nr:aminotransferase class III-fold pyridoxal phosphate-dependent enzyme [Candidatus Magasanikbacteria bacterium]